MGFLWGRLDFDGLLQDMAPSFGHVLRCVLTHVWTQMVLLVCPHCVDIALPGQAHGAVNVQRAGTYRQDVAGSCPYSKTVSTLCIAHLFRTSTAVPGNFSATKMANAFGTVLAILAGKARKLIWALEQGSVLQEITFVR